MRFIHCQGMSGCVIWIAGELTNPRSLARLTLGGWSWELELGASTSTSLFELASSVLQVVTNKSDALWLARLPCALFCHYSLQAYGVHLALRNVEGPGMLANGATDLRLQPRFKTSGQDLTYRIPLHFFNQSDAMSCQMHWVHLRFTGQTASSEFKLEW